MLLLILAAVFAALAFCLALDHLYRHHQAPPPDGIPYLCLLQPKDFCACHCTHENWITALGLAASTFLVLSFLNT